MKESIAKPVEAVVKGKIPEWISGSLYRNGPGKYELGEKSYFHLFDGLACVHKYAIKDGRVTYYNKLLDTHIFKRAIAENRLYPVFGTADVCSNVFGRLKSMYVRSDLLDNVNVNVVPYADQHLYALTETNLMCRLDPNDLSVLEKINITDAIPSARSTIAHPHVDRDGSWITMGMNLSDKKAPRYEFIRYRGGKEALTAENATKNAELVCSLGSSNPGALSYFHSFGLTDNYIVFIEQSMLFSLKDYLLAMLKNQPFSAALIKKEKMPARIHLIEKRTGKIVDKKFITDPFIIFHHINAYETTDENNNKSIVIDLCTYDPHHFDINALSYEGFVSEKTLDQLPLKAMASRVIVPLGEGTSSKDTYCKLNRMHNVSFELPTINYDRFNGRKYKYTYAVNMHSSPLSIVKLNMDDPMDYKERKYADGDGAKELPSEPVFVERPGASSEDDGVLLVMVLADQNDFLSVLDAKTLEEIGRAELPAEARGSFTFHGFFANSKMFQSNQN